MDIQGLTFRSKLLLAMLATVAAVTGATLYVTRHWVEATYRRLFEEQFQRQARFFTELQAARLSFATARSRDFGESVRLRGVLRVLMDDAEDQASEEYLLTAKTLYQTAMDEMADVVDAAPEEGGRAVEFIRLIDGLGQVVRPPEDIEAGLMETDAQAALLASLAWVPEALRSERDQQSGHIAIPLKEGGRLVEVVFTKVHDTTGEAVGALILGYPMAMAADRPDPAMQNGIWIGSQLFSAMPAEMGALVEAGLARAREPLGTFNVTVGRTPHRVFFQPLNSGTELPAAHQVSVYSMREAVEQQRDFTAWVLASGAAAVFAALLASMLLSHGLWVPIREVVKGTEAIQRGEFDVRVPVRSRDELGRLSVSFNRMAADLATKEKYRAVLNMVTDRQVADALMSGAVALGGEAREVSVLFCDIRGFTSLTEGMDPGEVIQMLNEHMTLLTKVVYEHRGVVDKFVGDLIMGLFGAPASYGDDAVNGAACALAMVRQRELLNERSRYRIRVGIGVATGRVVAGCMGSESRLNYTVLGERVNLAARLCSKAEPGEVVIDQTTLDRLGARAVVNPLAPLDLKGFTGPVSAYNLKELREET